MRRSKAHEYQSSSSVQPMDEQLAACTNLWHAFLLQMCRDASRFSTDYISSAGQCVARMHSARSWILHQRHVENATFCSCPRCVCEITGRSYAKLRRWCKKLPAVKLTENLETFCDHRLGKRRERYWNGLTDKNGALLIPRQGVGHENVA